MKIETQIKCINVIKEEILNCRDKDELLKEYEISLSSYHKFLNTLQGQKVLEALLINKALKGKKD